MTGRTFFDEINDEYELEQFVKHFFSLLKYFIKEHEDLFGKIFKTKNGRLIMQSKCVDCGIKKSRFVKEAKGLLSNLAFKT